jgi:hypothetical protein
VHIITTTTTTTTTTTKTDLNTKCNFETSRNRSQLQLLFLWENRNGRRMHEERCQRSLDKRVLLLPLSSAPKTSPFSTWLHGNFSMILKMWFLRCWYVFFFVFHTEQTFLKLGICTILFSILLTRFLTLSALIFGIQGRLCDDSQ